MRWPARSLCISVAVIAIPLAGSADEYELDWSSTFELRFDDFESPVDDDDVTGFFDQYEFTDNKDDQPAIQLGLSDFALDLLAEEETPRLQLRLRSPTSNLGLGSDFEISKSFLNQRGELYGRLPGLGLDLDYRRMRTDELRLFPNPTGVGAALASTYSDGTSPDDRFFTRRTGIGGELRLRPVKLLEGELRPWARMLSEIALRGGYGERKGKRQVRSRVGFTWSGLTTRLDQEVTRGGSGLVLHPSESITLAIDFDHERFREDATPLLQGGAAPQRTIAFIPDTDRTIGRVRLNARMSERAALHGGFQVSRLKQTGTKTPRQRDAGLGDNKLSFYSGNLATDVTLTDTLSANAFFKFDQRRNRIPQDTSLFNPSNGSQIVVFLKRVRWLRAGAEFVYRLPRMNRLALGFRGEWIDRDLDFATPFGFLGQAILRSTTVVDEDTRTFSGYLRSVLRPLSGVRFSSEVGFLTSPDTGYIRQLDDAVYGQLRASYTPPLPRPVTLSLFGRGESGQNHDFVQLGETAGPQDRDFDRDKFSLGATLTGSPREDVTLVGSVFHFRDEQDYPFIRSTDVRSFEASPFVDVDFFEDQGLDYRSDLTVFVVGGTVHITQRTDASLWYSYTRSHVRFLANGATARTIDDSTRIRSDIYRVELELGHWMREGLRVSAGYRFQKYDDRFPVTGAGVVPPFDLDTHQHTVAVSVTVNDALFR